MKQLLFFLALALTSSLPAQDVQTVSPGSIASNSLPSLMSRFSIAASVGSGNYANHFNQLSEITLGELTVNYKVNPRFSFGIGTIGSPICGGSYYNSEGILVSGDDDGDDDDDPFEDDDPDDEGDDPDDDGCDDDFGLGDNLMSHFTYVLSDKLPFFLQAGAGYSFKGGTPVYSALAGYNQKIFAGIGIRAGIRYSDIVKTANTKNYASPTGGIKAELGLSWNF